MLTKSDIESRGGRCRPLYMSRKIHNPVLWAAFVVAKSCNAKFLWQRIPNPVKAEHAELSKIWAVGRALWERNNPAAFATIGSTPWPDHVQPIMAAVKARLQEDSVKLIGESYSSIATGEFALSVGLPDTEALALALQQPGWSHDTQQKMIFPVKLTRPDTAPVPANLQLETLTDFVTFLER